MVNVDSFPAASVLFEGIPKTASIFGSAPYLSGLILMEAGAIGLAGGIGGTLLAAVLFFPFRTAISMALDIPFLVPNLGIIAASAVGTMILTLLAGMAAALFTVIKTARTDTYRTIAEQEF